MDPLRHIWKILLMLSIVFNFFLINLSLDRISMKQCFAANEEYKLLFEKRNKELDECIERDLLKGMQAVVSTTTALPKYEEELQKEERHSAEACGSLMESNGTFSQDGFVRDCISGDVIGKVAVGGLHLSHVLDINFNNETLGSHKRKKRESGKERQESFEGVFESRAWGRDWDSDFKGMSASGQGSTLNWTQEVSAVLHNLVNNIKRTKPAGSKVSILDVACGDMVWMSRFLQTRSDLEYTGLDVVPAVIEHHLERFKDLPWKFYVKDVVEAEKIASYDIIIARMVFQHLYHADILKILKLFSDSKSSYLLTTTFLKSQVNTELKINDENPGRFRELNLELPPFSLTHPLCYTHDGHSLKSIKNHYAVVWKLPLSFVKDCKQSIKKYSSKSNTQNRHFFSCSMTKFLEEF